jgi:ATP-binding protein involved in chromosome partitioning
MSAPFAVKPLEIRRTGDAGLHISWSDGTTQRLSSESLRRNCPCAGCREARGDDTHAKPLTGKKRSLTIVQNTLEQELGLTEIWGVGQYAIGLRWADGHDTGIYTFDYLRAIS